MFEAMLNAGTPCPKDGLVGDKARICMGNGSVKKKYKEIRTIQ